MGSVVPTRGTVCTVFAGHRRRGCTNQGTGCRDDICLCVVTPHPVWAIGIQTRGSLRCPGIDRPQWLRRPGRARRPTVGKATRPKVCIQTHQTFLCSQFGGQGWTRGNSKDRLPRTPTVDLSLACATRTTDIITSGHAHLSWVGFPGLCSRKTSVLWSCRLGGAWCSERQGETD